MTVNVNETTFLAVSFTFGGATRNFTCGEETLALRLVSELPDLRAAIADRGTASIACNAPSTFGSNISK